MLYIITYLYKPNCMDLERRRIFGTYISLTAGIKYF